MADKPEILVHVGAPSAGSDDARYRALVASSLAFEPVSRRCVLCMNDNSDGTGIEVNVDGTRSLSLASSSSQLLPRREATTSFNSGDELCRDDFEKSKVIATTSPLELNRTATIPLNGNNNLSFHPESTEEDSELSFQPLIPLSHQPRVQSQQGSPHKPASVHETNAGIAGNETTGRKNSPIVDNHIPESSTWETPLDTIPDSQEADQTILNDSAVQVDRSFVPDSVLQTRRSATGKDGKEDWAEESRLSDITRIPSSIPSPSPERTLDRQVVELNNQLHERPPEHKKISEQTAQCSSTSTSVLGKRKDIDTRSSRGASTTKTASEEPPPPPPPSSSNPRPKKRQTLPHATETISLDNLPIEIRAPNPPVSNGRFQTHITPTLRSLAERMKQSSRFKPIRQTRELQPLERGYWFIPCISIVPDTFITSSSVPAPQTWTQTLFSQFWCFLREFLTEGRAGWGIWCLLESCLNNNNNNNQTEEQQIANANAKATKTVNLKLYTWGEVAPHLYLLLFLATERRIKKMRNVEWRDARDDAVITMT